MMHRRAFVAGMAAVIVVAPRTWCSSYFRATEEHDEPGRCGVSAPTVFRRVSATKNTSLALAMTLVLGGCSISGNPYAVQAPASPTTPAVAPAAPVTVNTPPVALSDLREWAPGKWRSTGGTNKLVIDRALRWSWESSAGGKWSGSGRGEIRDGWLILRGFHSTSLKPMMLRLVREGDALVGELHISRQYTIMYVRE